MVRVHDRVADIEKRLLWLALFLKKRHLFGTMRPTSTSHDLETQRQFLNKRLAPDVYSAPEVVRSRTRVKTGEVKTQKTSVNVSSPF